MKKIFIKSIIPFFLTLIILIPGCYSADFLGGMKVTTETITRWVSSAPTLAPGIVNFLSVAVDSNGNIYAVGSIAGKGIYNFGTGNISGTSTGSNVLIIKYNSSGTIQWAKTVGSGSPDSPSCFNSVAVDTNGNIYAAGYLTGIEGYDRTYYFNSSDGDVTCIDGNTFKRIVIVKYNSSGEALWAKSIVNLTLMLGCEFKSIAVNSNGEIFAAGYITGTTTFNFETATATGMNPGENVVLVKYSSSGAALWATTATTAPAASGYNSVAVDSNGNIYAAGYITNDTQFRFGSSSSGDVSGGTTNNKNAVLVKYNSSGEALWAKSTFNGAASTENYSAAVDARGNIYTAGTISGNSTSANFGIYSVPVTATGISSAHNICLVKYNSSGEALWARSNSTGSTSDGYSYLNSVIVNASGDIFCSGYIYIDPLSSFNILNIDGLSVAGMPSSANKSTCFLVKFNSVGTAQWIRSSSTGSSLLKADSLYNSVTVDSNGYIYAAGVVFTGDNNNTVLFGNNISITQGVSQYSPVVVKYKEMNIVNFE